ncbi:MAG: hypothetical protein U9N32_08665, partial [Spirochaetota bacterium]|nr:hypothetical protein [Spirochaetota bacterium]
MDTRDKELTELLLFSASAEIEIYTDRNLFERYLREIHDGYLQKEITLKQYPVKRIARLYCDSNRDYNSSSLVDPEYYSCYIPPANGYREISSEIILIDGYSFPKGRNAIQVIYKTGYKTTEMPENLKRATLELVDWNLKRMRGGQLGAEGLVGTGKGQIHTF